MTVMSYTVRIAAFDDYDLPKGEDSENDIKEAIEGAISELENIGNVTIEVVSNGTREFDLNEKIPQEG